MKIHVGTSAYGYKEWKGSFYPAKISSQEMLRSYSERLSAVEINYTFYHMPRKNSFVLGGTGPRQFFVRKNGSGLSFFSSTLKTQGGLKWPCASKSWPGQKKADPGKKGRNRPGSAA